MKNLPNSSENHLINQRMENKHHMMLNSALESLKNCKAALDKISKSCCMKERSTKMKEAFTALEGLVNTLNTASENQDKVQKSIEKIAELGSKMGALYATCCTPIKAPLYQGIFKELGIAHRRMWEIMGVSH
ncbi:hypothetical protein [Xanthovirga aplysinae]|uniref:hypothetical protein n=1 Tax=Xanthovirga aplysinae TaxID=2529853 RepID=UPI0012BBEEDA|nr:hypothetical protein [Xanthovirga aplysinae]MTI32653.1 hypothetical protein [Xanthovirga aplysinae]